MKWNWAVLKQISRVIRECKKQGVETSICGQAGSKKEMVKFLVKQGISSISVNADVAKEISELVRDLEGGNAKSDDENNSKIEKIDNIEEIKEEVKEIKNTDAQARKELENPEAVITEEKGVNESASSKEDIFS